MAPFLHRPFEGFSNHYFVKITYHILNNKWLFSGVGHFLCFQLTTTKNALSRLQQGNGFPPPWILASLSTQKRNFNFKGHCWLLVIHQFFPTESATREVRVDNLTNSDKNWSRSLRSSTSSWNALYRRQTWWSIWISNSTSMNRHKGLLKSLMIPCYTSMHDQIILQQLFVQILKISTTELAYYLVMKRFAIKKKKCTKMHWRKVDMTMK